MHLAWSKPTNSGGIGVSTYYLQRAIDSGCGNDCFFTTVYKGDARSIVVYGLKSSTAYLWRTVMINNASKTSVPSDVRQWKSLHTTYPGIINAVEVDVDQPKTGGMVTVSWVEPRDTGGVPITGYKLYYKKASENGRKWRPAFNEWSKIKSFTLCASR